MQSNYLAGPWRLEGMRDELGNIVMMRINRDTGESQKVGIPGEAMPRNAFDVRHYMAKLNKYPQMPMAYLPKNYLIGGGQ